MGVLATARGTREPSSGPSVVRGDRGADGEPASLARARAAGVMALGVMDPAPWVSAVPART